MDAQERKAAARMLLSSPDQDLFFKLAFDHYSEKLDEPFDFLEKLFSLHPLPSTIGNNFFALMKAGQSSLPGSRNRKLGPRLCRDCYPSHVFGYCAGCL